MLTKRQILFGFYSFSIHVLFLFCSPIQDPMLHLVLFFWRCIFCVYALWTLLPVSYAWAFKHFLIVCNYKQCYTPMYIDVFSYCCGCNLDKPVEVGLPGHMVKVCVFCQMLLNPPPSFIPTGNNGSICFPCIFTNRVDSQAVLCLPIWWEKNILVLF